jgi:hypothetical protein
MGGEPHRNPMMARTDWWLTETVSRLLEPDERDAVLGDFAESGETGRQALLGVLGLVARRQSVVWMSWRPWLTLVGLIVPLGMLLSIVSRTTANGSAVYLWLYANNLDWALLRNPGFWRLLPETIELLFLWYLTLGCWSWTSGFVLGPASRGMVRINGFLLCLMLLLGELFVAPRYFAYCDQYIHRVFGVPSLPDYNAVVFENPFYRVMFPLIIQAVLVAIPTLWGMRQGLGAGKLQLRFRIALWTAAVITLAAMVIQERGFWLFLNPHVVNAYLQPGLWLGRGIRFVQFAVYWPVVYLAPNAIRQCLRARTVSA